MDYILTVMQGLVVVLSPPTIYYMVGGFLIGAFFGAMPGLTATLAVALLLPVTYAMDFSTALVMCASIFMAGVYAGSITATTINIPGAPSSMMTALEGYVLMQRGQGANALGHAAFASMIGGVLGAILLVALLPIAGTFVLLIKTPGKAALLLFALVVVSLMDRRAIVAGIMSTLVGMWIATIGVDTALPVVRFSFGTDALKAGIDLMAIIIGTFAVAELLIQLCDRVPIHIDESQIRKLKRRGFVPKLEEIRRIGLWVYIKSTIIGFFIGVLPGAGGSMAAFVAYVSAYTRSKTQHEYRNGSREGIAAAEAANNAMCGGAFVPMLLFGIPGDALTAIVLGILIINGIDPGVSLVDRQLPLLAPMFWSLIISALILIPLTLYVLGPWFIKIVNIPRGPLYALIAVISVVGTYVATISTAQMFFGLAIGALVFMFRICNYPVIPFLLGFILEPEFENYTRRALELSKGDPIIFLTNWDSIFFLVLTIVFCVLMFMPKRRDVIGQS